ncbi:MAG: hypothetical protein QOJ51_2657 [Acidobacteriaceae bacterium]|jgi:hypothetical protein|nr:hypothetical protein [Acidobacteriaceae bacterium]
MSYTATYSPEDNKLRLYSSTRLDHELYARVRDAGFIYAPKQELFVAPMWTPEREDHLIELCGEIDDEDTSLSLPASPAAACRSRLCSTLPSDPASRRRPCASLSLLLHQDVKRTSTSKLLNNARHTKKCPDPFGTRAMHR